MGRGGKLLLVVVAVEAVVFWALDRGATLARAIRDLWRRRDEE